MVLVFSERPNKCDLVFAFAAIAAVILWISAKISHTALITSIGAIVFRYFCLPATRAGGEIEVDALLATVVIRVATDAFLVKFGHDIRAGIAQNGLGGSFRHDDID
jgi:hypothetical protein